MRILVISNLYPPHYLGGYELSCRDVVEALKARGHKVKVLTSTYGVREPESDQVVYRLLRAQFGWERAQFGWEKHWAAKFAKRIQIEINNQRAFKKLCTAFNPDLIYIWGLEGVPISLVFMAQRTKLPISYYILDYWLSRWYLQLAYTFHPVGNRLFYLCLRALRLQLPIGSLDLTHVQFVSQYLKSQYLKKIDSQAAVQLINADVTHLGIDVNSYSYREARCNPRHLLYVGQIVAHKGVHTAIEALQIIIQRYGYESATLTIVGGTVIPDYEAHLRRLVNSLDLENHVRFTGPVPRESLPPIYQEHDILIFPSIWDEPLGLTPLEAMSSGLAVVGTGTGGSSEILQDEVNALVFPKENGETCARQIVRLMEDPQLFERIRQSGRSTVEEKFRFDDMMERVENSIHEAVVGSGLLGSSSAFRSYKECSKEY